MGVAHTWTRFRGDLPLTSVEEAGRQARRGCASPRLVMSARSPLTLRTSSVYPHESADGDPPRVFPLSHTTRRSANGQSNVVLFAAPALSLSFSPHRASRERTNERPRRSGGREGMRSRPGGRPCRARRGKRLFVVDDRRWRALRRAPPFPPARLSRRELPSG